MASASLRSIVLSTSCTTLAISLPTMLFISSVITEPLLIEPSLCAKGLLIIARFEGFVKILSLLLLLFSLS
jgi:hypothetical protein